MEGNGFRKVEKIRIDDLTPLAKNPRRHSERDMELDPRYCDVIRQRYAALAGAAGDWREATPREG